VPTVATDAMPAAVPVPAEVVASGA
jgi:hypothetical protein